MLLNDKLDIIAILFKTEDKKAEFYDSLDRTIESAFYDNPAIIATEQAIDKMRGYIFDDYEQFIVDWILYEWKYDNTRELELGTGENVSFSSIEEIIEFLRKDWYRP